MLNSFKRYISSTIKNQFTFSKHRITICMAQIKAILNNVISVCGAVKQPFLWHPIFHLFGDFTSLGSVSIPEIGIVDSVNLEYREFNSHQF